MGSRDSLRNGKHFWAGRMFTPLEAVVVLTLTTNADRAGVWGSPLRSFLTPPHSNRLPAIIVPASTRNDQQ